jgi:two-component system, NarL family, sensor histidine kinase DesK
MWEVASVVTARTPVILRAAPAYRAEAPVAARSELGVDALGRLASLGALALAVALPLVVLLAFAVSPSISDHFPEALAATALYLPLHVRHVRFALRGMRPPGLHVSLPAMAVAIAAPAPMLGAYWLYAFHALAASVLVTTRSRIALPAVAAILAWVAVWANHFGSQVGHAQDVYLPAAVLDRAMMVFLLVWLVRALRRIQLARRALAEEVLEGERRRVDTELGATVGAQLEDVVRTGQRALRTLGSSVREAEAELVSLVEGSRGALMEARRLTGRYQLVSSRIELDKAASLLRAAGMRVRLEVPDDALPPWLDEPLRTSLRATVARLLAAETTSPVVLRLRHDGGAYSLEALPDAVTEPAA